MREKSEGNGFRDLVAFEFQGRAYAIATDNRKVCLRCVDRSLDSVDLPLPVPHDCGAGKEAGNAYETWDYCDLEFKVGEETATSLDIEVVVSEQNGYSYPGQFDDSVPPVEKKRKYLFIRRIDDGIKVVLK